MKRRLPSQLISIWIPMNIHYTNDDDLQVAPLSNSEKQWIEKFDALMSKMPKRLRVLEAGDGVFIYDDSAADGTDLDGNLAHEKGLVLAQCYGATLKINSVSA